MKSMRSTARSIGILFLLAAVIGMLGILLKSLPGNTENSDQALRTIADKFFHIKASVFCDVVSNSFLLLLVILFFPIIKDLNAAVARWCMALAVVGLAINILVDVNILSLLSLSQDYVNHPKDADLFWRLGRVKQDDYLGAHFLSLIVTLLWQVPLYSVLFRSKLIPRFLSAWGILAASIAFVAAWLLIFDIEITLLLFLQNAIFVLFFSIWLIAKGFNSGIE